MQTSYISLLSKIESDNWNLEHKSETATQDSDGCSLKWLIRTQVQQHSAEVKKRFSKQMTSADSWGTI